MAGRIARGVSGLVGLGQEAYQHNKEKKEKAAQAQASSSGPSNPPAQDPHGAPSSYQEPQPPSYVGVVDQEKGETDISVSSDEEDDEDLWIEDDAQNEVAPHEQQTKRPKTHGAEEWVQALIARNPAPPMQMVPLPAPVCIPQRRPGSRTRGFVRAYAPALADGGIDEKAWLEIMDGFQEQMGGQNWFNAANLAVALSVLSYTASVAVSIPSKSRSHP